MKSRIIIMVGLLCASAMAQFLGGLVTPVKVKVKEDNPDYAQAFVSLRANYFMDYGSDFNMGDNVIFSTDLFLGKMHFEMLAEYEIWNMFGLIDDLPDVYGQNTGATKLLAFSLGGSWPISHSVRKVPGKFPYSATNLGGNSQYTVYAVRYVDQEIKQLQRKSIRGGLYYLTHPISVKQANGKAIHAPYTADPSIVMVFDDIDTSAYNETDPNPPALSSIQNLGIYIGFERLARTGVALKVKQEGNKQVFDAGGYGTSVLYADLLLTPVQTFSNIAYQGYEFKVNSGTAVGQFDPTMFGARVGIRSLGGKGMIVPFGMELYGYPGMASYGFKMEMGIGGSFPIGKVKSPALTEKTKEEIEDEEDFGPDEEEEPAEKKVDPDAAI